MGFFSAGLKARHNVAFKEPFWDELMASFRSNSGQPVNVNTALQVMSVLGCLRVISEDVAQISRGLFKKRPGGGSDEAIGHPVRKLFLRKPNDWQTSFEFLEMLVLHSALSGRFICFKNVVRNRLVELIPFEPGCVQVVRNDDLSLTYRVTAENGEYKEFPQSAIWHVRGPSWNGWDGMEIMKLARQAIGLSIAAEEAHALMHANGGQTSGIYSVDGKLDSEQYKQLKAWIDKSTVGAKKFSPLILDRGTKWLSTAMTGVDAQHIETRKHQIEEVCRAFRVMPIMIGYSDKTATYASSEQMFDAHVKYTLGSWFRRIEESIGANLLTEAEWDEGYYFKFLPNSLLRGTAKDRGEFYYRLWQMGAINANQIRAMEEMNPYEGGEVYRVPINFESTDSANDPSKDEPAPPGLKTASRLNVGRVLSARNETRIREADTALNAVLAELDGEEQE